MADVFEPWVEACFDRWLGELTWSEIAREWDGRVADEAIAEAIAIAPMVVRHEPFKGFHVGARRKSARRAAALAA